MAEITGACIKTLITDEEEKAKGIQLLNFDIVLGVTTYSNYIFIKYILAHTQKYNFKWVGEVSIIIQYKELC
jgi:hypothetical protein